MVSRNGNLPREALIKAKIDITVCECCGYKQHRNDGTIEIHHIIPWECGGRNDAANLMPLCAVCHRRIHNIHQIRRGEWNGPTTKRDTINKINEYAHVDRSQIIKSQYKKVMGKKLNATSNIVKKVMVERIIKLKGMCLYYDGNKYIDLSNKIGRMRAEYNEAMEVLGSD